jgi:peptidoglycan/LPS O-acetylase OafA/YrhL
MSQPRQGRRIAAIDSMRGVASLMVACHHFNGALAGDLAWLPVAGRHLLHEGALGVQIFFVLSGYVIALSTEKLEPCLSNVGRFVLRRGTRLDPPYLVSIVLAVGALAATNWLVPGLQRPLPGPGMLLAHVVYLQNILGYGNLVIVYWSLCFEVQMYLLYVVLSFLEQRWNAGRDRRQVALIRVVTWYPLLLVSLLVRYQVWPLETPGWCLPSWYLFFLGSQVRWVHAGRISRWELVPSLVLVTALGLPAYPLEFLAIAAGLATVFWHRPLSRYADLRPLLFLGGISYSLYLIHPIVGGRFVNLLRKFTGGTFSPPESVAAFVAGVLVSVVAAWLLYRAVERPTMNLSRRIRLRRRDATT